MSGPCLCIINSRLYVWTFTSNTGGSTSSSQCVTVRDWPKSAILTWTAIFVGPIADHQFKPVVQFRPIMGPMNKAVSGEIMCLLSYGNCLVNPAHSNAVKLCTKKFTFQTKMSCKSITNICTYAYLYFSSLAEACLSKN